MVSQARARRGGMGVSEVQRSRMLSSAARVVSEHGYGEMSISRVTSGAGVSRRTFYDMFEDREDCFLAVFEDALERVSERVRKAYEGEREWRERVRAGLCALLEFLDERPELGSLLVVNALRAGPRVLERRAEVLEQVGRAIHESGSRSEALPPLTGAGVVGAVFSVIHTHLLQKDPGSLVELLNPLMGMIVLPYLGPGVARRELDHPAPKVHRASKARAGRARSSVSGDPFEGLSMRLTYRTLRVLTVIGGQPGVSNRMVAETAGVGDQGQMSKLLARLERLGLIHNTGRGHPHGETNAWRLTPRGKEVERAIGIPSVDDGGSDRRRGSGGRKGSSRR